MEKIRFKVDTATFRQALDTISFVKPQPVGSGTLSGYRFVVEGNKCSIFSRNNLNVARAQFDVTDVEGEGTFLYPAEHISGFSFFTTGSLIFEATHEGNTYKVNAVSTDRKGLNAWRVSSDPRHMRPIDRDFSEAKAASDGQSFSSATLKQALSLSVGFRPVSGDNNSNPGSDKNKYTIEIYDAKVNPKADGVMYATDGFRTFHYRSEEFVGKSLEIATQHVDLLQQFLDKSPGRVTVYKTKTWTWAENSVGHVFGWGPIVHKQLAYQYYNLEKDIVLNIDPQATSEALSYLKTQIGDGQRVKVIHKDNALQFQISDDGSQAMGVTSWEVPVTVNPDSKVPATDFNVNVSLDSLRNLFKPISGSNQILLRVFISEDPKRKRVLLRTVDTGILSEKGIEGTPQCKAEVTRFTPSFE